MLVRLTGLMMLAVDVQQIEGLKCAEVLRLYIKNRKVLQKCRGNIHGRVTLSCITERLSL